MRKPRLSAVAALIWLLTAWLLPADSQTSTEQPCMVSAGPTQSPGIILQAQKLEYVEGRKPAGGDRQGVGGLWRHAAAGRPHGNEHGKRRRHGNGRRAAVHPRRPAAGVAGGFRPHQRTRLGLRRQRPHRQHVSRQQRASGTPRAAALCGTARSAHDVHRAGSRLGVSRPAGPPRRGQLRDPAAPVLSHQGRAGVLPAVRRPFRTGTSAPPAFCRRTWAATATMGSRPAANFSGS